MMIKGMDIILIISFIEGCCFVKVVWLVIFLGLEKKNIVLVKIKMILMRKVVGRWKYIFIFKLVCEL